MARSAVCHVYSFLLLFLPLLFAAAERADTSQAETHARQSYALSQQGRLPEAEQEMREAIRLAPRNPLYHSALGGLLAKDEKLSEAKEELEKALALKPAPAVRTQLSERLKEVDLNFGAQLGRTGHDREGMNLAAGAAWCAFPKMLGYFKCSGIFKRSFSPSRRRFALIRERFS